MEPLSAILNIGKAAIDRIWPDPLQRAEEFRKLQELEQRGDLARLEAEVQLLVGQMEINKQEAQSKSIFVAGWRPFTGWVAASSFAYMAILEPLMRFTATMTGYEGDFPVLDTTITMQILMGMLGLGLMRSYEKKNKCSTERIKEK